MENEEITGIVLGVLKEINKSSTCTRTTKYGITVVKPAVVRLPEPTYRKPVIRVLARVLKYGSKVHAQIGLG
jgi:hypothetical protein